MIESESGRSGDERVPGRWNRSLSLKLRKPIPSCIYACQTRRARTANDSGIPGESIPSVSVNKTVRSSSCGCFLAHTQNPVVWARKVRLKAHPTHPLTIIRMTEPEPSCTSWVQQIHEGRFPIQFNECERDTRSHPPLWVPTTNEETGANNKRTYQQWRPARQGLI